MGTAREYNIQTGKRYSVITFEPCLADCKWGEIERVGTEIKTQLTASTQPYCLLDLSKLEFMGSSIVALLVRVWKAVQEQHGGMVLVNPNTMTKEVLEIAGLAKVWTICNSRPEAEQALTKVLPPEPQTAGVVAAIFGWVLAGATLALVLAQRNQFTTLPTDASQAITYAGSGLSVALNLVAIVKGGGVWRLFGIVGLVVAIGLIAALAGNLLS